MLVITYDHLEELKTPRGGYTSATIKALGSDMKKKGWRQRLIGKHVTEEQYQEALDGREKFYKKMKRKKQVHELPKSIVPEMIVINGTWYKLTKIPAPSPTPNTTDNC